MYIFSQGEKNIHGLQPHTKHWDMTEESRLWAGKVTPRQEWAQLVGRAEEETSIL